jgi:hypothetical protein
MINAIIAAPRFQMKDKSATIDKPNDEVGGNTNCTTRKEEQDPGPVGKIILGN